jgi:CheY-like chemotaxis protein
MEKARILIVEDEAIIAMEIESQLQALGYKVTSIVDTGEDAIEKAEEYKPDIILMDIRIKGKMDGIETAEVIRKRFGIPVIFTTAYLDQERIQRAKIVMPFGYVLKPIQERDLKVTIEMALYVAKANVERKKVEESLKKIEWLLQKSVKQKEDPSFVPFYGDVTDLNTSQVIKGAIDAEILNSIASDTIDLLETSVAIYEKNGDYAFGMFSSGWCQLMDSTSRKLCNTDDNQEALKCGKWLCHDNCWNESAKTCIESCKPTDIECIGGIHLYAEPIIANQEVIGVINIGYGNPPIDEKTLKVLSDRFSIPIDDLRNTEEDYDSRPFYITELAKKKLKTSAMLIGKMVESDILQKKLPG